VVTEVHEEVHEVDEMGPVDYLVLEFPKFTMTGDAMRELLDLVGKGVIRVLDLVFVRKDQDGRVSVLAAGDLQSDGEFDSSVFEGARSGLLGRDDIDEVASALQPGSAGATLVYENLWAAPLARALRRNGAQLVAGGRIPIQAILASLDATEKATA